MSETIHTPEEILKCAVAAADGKKAVDMTAIKVTKSTTLADYFVIMTGTSNTHIRALSEEIEKKLKTELEVMPHHIEGISSNWVLLDYNTVVINVFLAETRELYALERLWADAEKVDLEKYIGRE